MQAHSRCGAWALVDYRERLTSVFHNVAQVISRRLHKFFNISELPETEPEKVDIGRPHIILEKMDGYVMLRITCMQHLLTDHRLARCLVAPFMSEGRIRFGSKMGVTEMSVRMEETHLARCDIDYYSFAKLWLGEAALKSFAEFGSNGLTHLLTTVPLSADRGFTPIFEYCSAQHQIVVGYEEDFLMLLAMRHNTTGICQAF